MVRTELRVRTSRPSKARTAAGFVGLALAAALWSSTPWLDRFAPAALAEDEAQPALRVDKEAREVRVRAVAQPKVFSSKARDGGAYHLLVWDQGAAKVDALLLTAVAPYAVREGLDQIGVRFDAGNGAAPAIAEPPGSISPAVLAGDRVEVLLQWKGKKSPVRLREVLDDPGGRGFDFRASRAQLGLRVWSAGTIVALFGDPTATLANAVYSMKDDEAKTTRFRPKKGKFPKDDTEVTVVFRLSGDARADR